MPRNQLNLYIHFVWSTWDRLPMISPNIERRLHRNIEASAKSLNCRVIAINGVQDHVHVLLSLPSTVTVADLVKKMKGTSSHFVNDQLRPQQYFKWQGSYGAFSVSRWDLPRIIEYIKRQKEHHAQERLWEALEASCEFVDEP